MSSKHTNKLERMQAKEMRHGQGKGSAAITEEEFYEKFPAAVLSPDAKQKYALFEVSCDAFAEPKYLVRGDARASYHKDAAAPLTRQLSMSMIKGLRYDILGGGRIVHNSKKKQIEIYGHSYGFPWKDGVYKHEISAEACRKAYPGYEVAHNNTEGLY